MSTQLFALGYRALFVVGSMLSIYLGFVLFRVGIFGSAGDVDARMGNNRLLIKRGAPGTFFALVGAAVMLTALFKPLHLPNQLPASAMPAVVKAISGEDLGPGDRMELMKLLRAEDILAYVKPQGVGTNGGMAVATLDSSSDFHRLIAGDKLLLQLGPDQIRDIEEQLRRDKVSLVLIQPDSAAGL